MSIEDFLLPLPRHYLEAPSWLKAPTAGRPHAWLPRVIRGGGAAGRLALRGPSAPGAARPGGVWMVEPIKQHLIPSSDHLERRHMPRHAEGLVRHRLAFIEAFPSALYPIARWLMHTAGARMCMAARPLREAA